MRTQNHRVFRTLHLYGTGETVSAYASGATVSITLSNGSVNVGDDASISISGQNNNINFSTNSGTAYLAPDSSAIVDGEYLYMTDSNDNYYYDGTVSNPLIPNSYQNGSIFYSDSELTQSYTYYYTEYSDTYTVYSYEWDDPVVLNLVGSSIETTPLASQTTFDYTGSGHQNTTSWIVPGESFLVYMPNTMSGVLNGTNLVSSLQSLAQYDSNGDGQLTSADAEWSKLGIWTATDSSGVIEANKVKSLTDSGISSISLSSTGDALYQNGSFIEGKATVALTNGQTGVAADVDLQFINANGETSSHFFTTSSLWNALDAKTDMSLTDFQSAIADINHFFETSTTASGIAKSDIEDAQKSQQQIFAYLSHDVTPSTGISSQNIQNDNQTQFLTSPIF